MGELKGLIAYGGYLLTEEEHKELLITLHGLSLGYPDYSRHETNCPSCGQSNDMARPQMHSKDCDILAAIRILDPEHPCLLNTVCPKCHGRKEILIEYTAQQRRAQLMNKGFYQATKESPPSTKPCPECNGKGRKG